MSIEIMTIAKPTITLAGDVLKEGSSSKSEFFGRVDHAKHLNPTTTSSINGVTILDQENILIFERNVRIIITDNTGNKPTYERESGIFDPLIFEGNKTYSSEKNQVNNVSETFFTLNGRNPIRTRAYLYNYLDMNDAKNYNNPSTTENSEITNLTSLGFMLSASSTGSELITLKAKTYFQGNSSKVAVACFRIARPQNYAIFENREDGFK